MKDSADARAAPIAVAMRRPTLVGIPAMPILTAPLRVRRAHVEVRLACDIAAALDYAHRRGVIHRDIKPENILLHDGRALVADFGIARAVQRAASDDTLTGTGVTVGTPSYMSPEQAAADREVDARSDIYSLGCVVYEMLAGAPPFTGATAHAVIARMMTEEPRRLAEVRQTVPSQLSAAVQRALAKLPDIWIYNIASKTISRLTTGGVNALPEWTPDGKRIAWTSATAGHEGIWWQPWDQSAPAELLVPNGRGAAFTPRGDGFLTTFEVAKGLEVRFIALPFDARQVPRVVLPPAAGDRQPRFSPDGHWLAYLSDETGLREVFVQAFPGPGGHFQISTGGASSAIWSPSGKELVYITAGCCVISATIATTPEFAVLRRDTLFSVIGTRGGLDITRDGNHFITSRQAGGASVPVVVFGWADEVRERVDAANRK